MSRLLSYAWRCTKFRRRRTVRSSVGDEEERSLVAQALDGQPSARRELADRLLDSIHREVAICLLRWGVPRDQLDDRLRDLVQDVLVMLFENDGRELRRWDPQRGRSLDSFVRLVARRWVARKLGRKTVNLGTAELDEGTVGPAAPSSGAENRTELQWILQRLYAEMTPRDVELFELLFVEEVEPSEAAERLEMTRGAVNAWSYRMRKQAREFQAADDARAERTRHHA